METQERRSHAMMLVIVNSPKKREKSITQGISAAFKHRLTLRQSVIKPSNEKSRFYISCHSEVCGSGMVFLAKTFLLRFF